MSKFSPVSPAATPSAVRAQQASYVAVPADASVSLTVVEFLCQRFPHIDVEQWRARIKANNVYWHDKQPVTLDSLVRRRQRLYYYREVAVEAKIPLQHRIVYQDEQIIIAYKPPFLALHPSGKVINECLVNRLRQQTGLMDIEPAHRLDRATGGLVLLSKTASGRDAYHRLFRDGEITKTYQAIAPLTPQLSQCWQDNTLTLPLQWQVRNRIVKATPSFTRKVVDGEPNSHSIIKLEQVKAGLGLFSLAPITGRTHQLRLHMHSLGMPIINDLCYPQLQAAQDDDYNQPLQLLAQRLQFNDPITAKPIDVSCEPLTL